MPESEVSLYTSAIALNQSIQKRSISSEEKQYNYINYQVISFIFTKTM